MAPFDFKQSKPLAIFLMVCLAIILSSTLYVAFLAYRQHRAGDNLIDWREEFGPVANKASRSVVAIKTTQTDKNSRIEYNNAGSGFIIDASGIIITNEHVIHNVESIRVTLIDKRPHIARVIGSDPRSDLAILKIDADGLTALEIADPASTMAGQPVIALGNPMGSGDDGQTVATFGRITRLNKVLDGTIDEQNDRFYDNLIQTDILILPGSSGGPLINLEGRVIGINAAMGRALETGKHFGFAITLDQHTQNRLAQLRQSQKIHYAFLGVETAEVSVEAGQALGLSDLAGAMVTLALPGFAGQQAGLREGDIIAAVNHKPIYSPLDLIATVNRCDPGRQIMVEFYRAGQSKNQRKQLLSKWVYLDQRHLADLKGSVQEANQKSLEHTQWGLTLKPLTYWRRNRLGLNQYQKGILVYDVSLNSPAASQQLQPGDVIIELAGLPIHHLKDFYQTAKQFDQMPHMRTLRPQPLQP